MSERQVTNMVVRGAPRYDYLVEWEHFAQGFAGSIRLRVKPSRPWTDCSIFRIKKGQKEHPDRGGPGHLGMATARARLHPNDGYNYIVGERESLKQALRESFSGLDLPWKGPLPKDVRKLFWDRFNSVRAKLHKRRK